MTRKANTQEVLYWFLARITQGLMALSVILIVIIIIGDYKIRKMEQPTVIQWDTIFETKESVEDQAKRYVQSLPMPDMSDVPVIQEQPVVIQEEQPEIIQEEYIAEPVAETYELTTEASKVYTEEAEIYLLAKGIHGEASICDREEKYKVGTVIMNRVAHSRYPDTVEGVLAADGQYSCYQDNRWFTEEPSQEELEIARDIYVNGTRVFGPEVIYQSKLCAGECIEITPWHEYGTD